MREKFYHSHIGGAKKHYIEQNKKKTKDLAAIKCLGTYLNILPAIKAIYPIIKIYQQHQQENWPQKYTKSTLRLYHPHVRDWKKGLPKSCKITIYSILNFNIFDPLLVVTELIITTND